MMLRKTTFRSDPTAPRCHIGSAGQLLSNTMTNSLATASGLGDYTITITPAALKAKADAIVLARTITTVTNAAEQANAIAAASLMKGLLKDMKATHALYKRPIIDAGNIVDAAKNNYSAELETESARVEKLAANWQAEENRKAAAVRAEQERRDREEREQEQRALAAIAAKAEAERRANLAAIAAAKDEEAKLAAQIKADQDAASRAEEVRINQEAAQEAERNRVMTMQAVVPEKPQAARVVVKMDYELKDIKALYAARPDLVELSERRSLILAAISILGHPAIPGIYEYESTKVSAKAS